LPRVSRATTEAAPLVGRSTELDLLVGALRRTRRERQPQLVTIAGVPGIGKSRLVAELYAVVDADEELIAWRRGRSLPYGEGVSLWALGEIVKAELGVLESDPALETAAKLGAALAELPLDESEREWLERRLEGEAPSSWIDAACATCDRDFLRAAETYASIGAATAEAEARVFAAEHLHESGDRNGGEAQFRRALAFFSSVDATARLRELEALLSATA
jgi:AAA ATPase-like protein